jgi:hypothetical protein
MLVSRSESGERYVTDKLIYEGEKIVARITCTRGKVAFGDYARYEDGRINSVFRIMAGTLVAISAQAVAWVDDAEDFTARFIRPGGSISARSDTPFVLDFITLPARSETQYNLDGSVKSTYSLTKSTLLPLQTNKASRPQEPNKTKQVPNGAVAQPPEF